MVPIVKAQLLSKAATMAMSPFEFITSSICPHLLNKNKEGQQTMHVHLPMLHSPDARKTSSNSWMDTE
jgi:hypothetical protein